jgi:hypothetical protein
MPSSGPENTTWGEKIHNAAPQDSGRVVEDRKVAANGNEADVERREFEALLKSGQGSGEHPESDHGLEDDE